MYTFLIIFLFSLLGISLMIGRKLMLLKNGTLILKQKKLPLKIPDLHEVKYVLTKKSRKYGFITLIILVRFYVLSSDLVKKNYQISKEKTKKLITKYIYKKKENENKEASKFLKRISDYKQKIQRIKNQIKKEEGLE